MGKPSNSLTPRVGERAEDAVSLHTQPGDRYLDDDTPDLPAEDDLPPLYSDLDGPNSAGLPPSAPPEDLLPFRIEDANTGAKYYLHNLLDTSPKTLETHVKHWAKQPPRPYVQVKGTHQQTVDKNGKKERTTVTDFDVQIELTPYLYNNAAAWQELRTVDNGEKTKRGTVFKRRAPGATQSIEVGGDAKPTLEEWCHLYCASHAGLKAFSLRRVVVGFREDKVREKIEALVRGTQYRGHLAVTFPVKDDLVEVYSDCRTNAWRLTRWIQLLCMFTLMFIFTVPYLYFRTKRYEVVRSEWHFSRIRDGGVKEYVSLSEDNWFQLWRRALTGAVLEKRQCTLDQQDLLAAEGAGPAAPNTGHAAVDGALGFLRAGVNAMNEVNRQLGWGGDC